MTYMTELTLASRSASTVGIEGITSRYEADRAVAERRTGSSLRQDGG